MLVLGRKKNQTVIISELIKVTVLEVRGDLVKLGFEAPTDIPIVRGEIVGSFVPPNVPPPGASLGTFTAE